MQSSDNAAEKVEMKQMTQAEVQKHVQQMYFEMKKVLKQRSKNELIQLLSATIFENHSLQNQINLLNKKTPNEETK